MQTNFLLILALAISWNGIAAVDRTLEDGAVGRDVVQAVETKIGRSNIFPDDYEFFRRLAYVESRDGTSNTTLPNNSTGGIWQLTASYYSQTRDASLGNLHESINRAFQIKWADTTWSDLDKPLFSGLAARLFIAKNGRVIPQATVEQAHFFNSEYNHRVGMDNATFVTGVEELDNGTRPCGGKVDVVVVLDASSSVGQVNFELCKRFVLDLFFTFSLASVRPGFLVYSSDKEVIFELDSGLTSEELANKTLGAYYLEERTDTNEALLETAAMFTRAGRRPGVPQVMALLTDGKSTSPNGVSNIVLLKDKNVASLVIGVTNEVDLDQVETLAYNIPSNVFLPKHFVVLTEFYKRVSDKVCKLLQRPALDTWTQDSLSEGERRYYEFEVPAEGLTLWVTAGQGETTGFYSFSEQNPSSALFDGQLRWEGVFISAEEEVVYLSLEGLGSANNYTLEAITGFNVASTTQRVITTAEPATPSPLPETTRPGSTTEAPCVCICAKDDVFHFKLQNN